ncbi:MAG: NAD-dependent epimerase/dehydratase family protein [Bryobacteraceae bacterium]|jgi:nucleoside-diphosphate-sugar epimerase
MNNGERASAVRRKVLVIGGTLFIGRSLVSELLAAGHEVWVLHRKPEHDLGKRVGSIVADRNDPEAMRRVLSTAHFEVVFDNVYDWERGTTAAQVEAAARACGNHLHRYIFMSSVAAYGDGLNHHEGDALAPDDHPDPYVRNKAMTERALFRLHQRIGFPVATIRPPFIYGPRNPFYREAFFWDRMRDNRPIVLPGDGRRLMQFLYIKDLVTACLRAVEEPSANGHAFNVGNSRAITQAEAIAAFAEAAGKKPPVIRVPRERIYQLGGHPMGPQLYFGFYFDVAPITLIVTKAQRVLAFKATDFVAGLKETYRWYLRHHTKRETDYTYEDRLLGLAQAQAVQAQAQAAH